MIHVLLYMQVKTLTKELEEHQAYKPKGNKAKHNDLQVRVGGAFHQTLIAIYWP